MSLKGSLQTVALPEALKFLADTGKTGEMHVRGSHIEGRVWFSAGAVTGHDVGRSPDAVEALFQLLRNDDGDFSFSNGDGDPVDGHRVHDCDLTTALEQAEARFAEWNEIVLVVPSLEHRLAVAAEAPEDTVVMDRDQWALMVAIGEGRTVAQVIDARQMGEFDGCRAVKVFIESGLATIDEPDHPHFAAAATFEPASFEPVAFEPEPVAFEPEPVAFEPEPVAFEPEPVAFETAVEDPFDLKAVIDEPIPFETEADVDVATEDVALPQMTSDESPALNGDHYASLRAMIVDVDKDLSETGAAYDPLAHAPSDVADEDAGEVVDGKAALQALLAEVSSYPVAEQANGDEPANGSVHDGPVHDGSVDGLADRGPWPEHELASFDGWTESESAGDAVSQEPAEEEVPDEGQPSEEPINRGLLLKFLSSVRN